MADINRLSVLLNLANGDIAGLANQLQIDSNIIDTAITQGSFGLTRNDDLELTEKMSRFERLDLDGYEQASLQDYSASMDDLIDMIDDFRNGNNMRQAVAFDKVTLDEIQTSWLLFGQGDATLHFQNKIIDWLADNEHKADTFLNLFANDGYRLDSYESEFWEWYRCEFYGDC